MLKTKMGLILSLLLNFTITAQQKVVFDNWDTGGVTNWPVELTMFQLSESINISEITTYHWNNGKGSTGNAFGPYIKLFDVETSREFGPWKAKLTGGSYGAKNVTWTAYPNKVVPPGIYVVKDSDPATWSHNSGSERSGFVRILSGQRQQNISNSSNSNASGIWNSSFGVLTLTQNGNSISGSYPHDNGRVSGVMNGHTFLGTWSEAPSYKGPSDAGKVRLEFSNDWKSFSGKWGLEGKGYSGNWTGTRK